MNAKGNAKRSLAEPVLAGIEGLEGSDELDSAPENSGVRVISRPELRKALPDHRAAATNMRFQRKSVHCVLTVEAPACEDLMPELYRLLVSVHVQVVRVHAQVIADRVLHELDMLEFDSTPLEEERWRAVQTTVISYLGDRLLLDAPPAPLGALAERMTSLGA